MQGLRGETLLAARVIYLMGGYKKNVSQCSNFTSTKLTLYFKQKKIKGT